MKLRAIHIFLTAFVIVVMSTFPVWSEDSVKTAQQKKSSQMKLMIRLSDQDIILPISSIEWGIPDRWSMTSRYIHRFRKEQIRLMWRSSMGISLSPGTAGGRFAIGYQGVYSPKSMREFSVIGEVRFVLLYTWGNPLLTHPNRTLAGAELRCSLGWINVGTGYYWQISHTTDSHKNFYGYHIGVGI